MMFIDWIKSKIVPWRYVGSEGSKCFYEHRVTGERTYTHFQSRTINPVCSNGKWSQWLKGGSVPQ